MWKLAIFQLGFPRPKWPKLPKVTPILGGGGVFRPRCNEVGHCVMQWGGSPFRTKVNSDHTVIKVSRGQALIAARYMNDFFCCCAMQWGGSAGSGGKEYPSHSIYLYNIQGEWWRILVKKPIFHPPDRKKVLKTIKIGPKMGHFMTHARG